MAIASALALAIVLTAFLAVVAFLLSGGGQAK